MRAVERADDFALWCERYRAAGLSLGLVPTMGALHDGHLSLVHQSVGECDRTAVTVFVNPTQFDPGEDLDAYPSPLEEDLRLCEEAGVDLVFVGAAEDLYPPGFQTWVKVEELTRPLCGISRPHHFRGVTTVVTQLFWLARADRAYFGQKDYQQALVIGRMARDLHVPTQVCVCPTVREPDGLAMSSRNAYLEPAERVVALRLGRALRAGRDAIADGERDAASVRARMLAELQPGDDLRLDYLELRDAAGLAEIGARFEADLLRRGGAGVVIAGAVFVGSTRLIDNVLVGAPAESIGEP